MSKETTKAALLEAGRRIFLERGYNASGIEAILQTTGVPKGSFYHYFQSKEDFGLQVIDTFSRAYFADLDVYLADESRGPLERLRRFFESRIERLESQECRNGCLIGKLSQEMADQSETFRTRLLEVFDGWVDRVANCLEQARQLGEIPAHLDPRELAEFWLDGWQGALLRAKIRLDTAPLRSFLKLVRGDVLHV